ncbi:hypothetical protein TeGR_g13495, partial [Tetraparma gracilis]
MPPLFVELCLVLPDPPSAGTKPGGKKKHSSAGRLPRPLARAQLLEALLAAHGPALPSPSGGGGGSGSGDSSSSGARDPAPRVVACLTESCHDIRLPAPLPPPSSPPPPGLLSPCPAPFLAAASPLLLLRRLAITTTSTPP